MEYRKVNASDYEAIRKFLSEVGWEHRVADVRSFATMMENTSRAFVAVDGPRIIGFGRAVCDEVSNGYISMVAVAPDRRGHGIGRELVQHIMGADRDITWVLRAGHGSEPFWEAVGFKPSEVAMEKVRS